MNFLGLEIKRKKKRKKSKAKQNHSKSKSIEKWLLILSLYGIMIFGGYFFVQSFEYLKYLETSDTLGIFMSICASMMLVTCGVLAYSYKTITNIESINDLTDGDERNEAKENVIDYHQEELMENLRKDETDVEIKNFY